MGAKKGVKEKKYLSERDLIYLRHLYTAGTFQTAIIIHNEIVRSQTESRSLRTKKSVWEMKCS